MLFNMHIKRAEEIGLGVSEERTNSFRDEHGVPGSDDLQQLQISEACNSGARPRSGTIVPSISRQTAPSNKLRKKRPGAL